MKQNKKSALSSNDEEEIIEGSDVDHMELETVQDELGSLQAKWSDDEPD